MSFFTSSLPVPVVAGEFNFRGGGHLSLQIAKFFLGEIQHSPTFPSMEDDNDRLSLCLDSMEDELSAL